MLFDSIILDVDGTIWDTTEIVAQAWNKAIEENFPNVPRVSAEILQGQFGKPMNVIADNLFIGLSDSQKQILSKSCFNLEHIYIEANTKNITYPGVCETIASLSKKVPVFIVSNCQSGYIELVCRKNNIASYITDFECYGNNGFFKDKNIKLVIERNNLKNPVYVGDTQGDYDSCVSAGVPFIHAAYGFGKNLKGDFKSIEKFSDLLNFF